MKNKKLLNIFILLLALVTLISDILLFAFPAYTCVCPVFLKILYWVFNSLTLLTLAISILLTLISLFMDDYVAHKVIEAFVLLAFVTCFVNIIIFAMSKHTLSFLYVIVTVLAFLTANISQIVRLVASFPQWGSNLKALFKTHGPVTIIDATTPHVQTEDETKSDEQDYHDEESKLDGTKEDVDNTHDDTDSANTPNNTSGETYDDVNETQGNLDVERDQTAQNDDKKE